MKIKKRYGNHGGYLEHKIYEKPIENVQKKNLDDAPNFYIRFDDQFFICNNDLTGNIHMHIGLTVWLMFGLLFIFSYTPNAPLFPSAWGVIIAFLVGGASICYHYTRPEKHLILNRLDGIITIPNFFYGKPHVMPFSDALAAWSVKNAGVNPTVPRLSLFHPDGFKSTDVMGHDVIGDWSFIVWYMDKNRPLPLDNAFDEFRERDYERRKAEGFPKPLFPSDIPTPEATPEQQKERKKVGGW